MSCRRTAVGLVRHAAQSHHTSSRLHSTQASVARIDRLRLPALQRSFCASSLHCDQAPPSSALPPSSEKPSGRTVSSPTYATDTATGKVEKTRKRFWKSVDVAYVEAAGPSASAHLLVRLDGRSLKTPDGAVLAIPGDRPLLASLIAREWAEQEKIVRTHSLPMTSLAARAIDGLSVPKTHAGVVKDLVEYIHTETICFHEDHPANLVKLQHERWDPILAWTQEQFNTPKVRVYNDIFHTEQDAGVVKRLSEHISTYDAWDLAALERVVRSTKSFLIGLRLLEAVRGGPQTEAAYGVQEAALAAEVEVESQTQRWGEVEDTHDVNYADTRKTLASAACAVVRDSDEVARGVAQAVVKPK